MVSAHANQQSSNAGGVDKAVESLQIAPEIHDRQIQQDVLDEIKRIAAMTDAQVDGALRNLFPGVKSIERLVPTPDLDVPTLTVEMLVDRGSLNTRCIALPGSGPNSNRADIEKQTVQCVEVGGVVLGRKTFTMTDGTICSLGLSLTVTVSEDDGTILTRCIHPSTFETENHFDSGQLAPSIFCYQQQPGSKAPGSPQNTPPIKDPLWGNCTK